MPQRSNPARADLTVRLGKSKVKFMDACTSAGRTPSDVIREIVEKWMRAQARKRQRDAAADIGQPSFRKD